MQICLRIAYEGTQYAGWQRQANAVAVQQVIEEALEQIYVKKISIVGASRTDAGVHAMGQTASFSLENSRIPDSRIPIEKIPYVLNHFLPADISVTQAWQVAEEFSPRFDAREKTYEYRIWHGRHNNPLLRRFALFYPYRLDINAMRRAAADLVGRHDFAAFCAAGSDAKTTVREIYECSLSEQEELITLTVRGNAFLYNMVRIITGTLLCVGQGKIAADSMNAILASGDRSRSGITAPPHGLTLAAIRY
jgi:tRNA pseudouridine38-40 synthase